MFQPTIERFRLSAALLALLLCGAPAAAQKDQEQPGPQVHVNAGNEAFRVQRYAEAERLYLMALAQTEPSALPPDQAETVYFNLGHARSGQEKWEAAIEAYRKSRVEDELHWIANCLLQLGRLDEATLALQNFLVRFPDRDDVREQVAQLLVTTGRNKEALDAYQHLLTVRPGDERLHRAVANQLLALGRDIEALDRLEIAWRLGTRKPEVARLIADLYLQEGMHVEAATYYAKHLVLSDDVGADDLFRVGYTYFSGGEYTSAAKYFRKAIELDKRYANGFLYLGNIARIEGDTPRAVEAFRAALGADADLGEAHEALGTIELERGDLDAALHEFAEALRCGQSSVALHYNHVVTLIRADRRDEAVDALKQGLRAHPTDSRLSGLLAMLRR